MFWTVNKIVYVSNTYILVVMKIRYFNISYCVTLEVTMKNNTVLTIKSFNYFNN